MEAPPGEERGVERAPTRVALAGRQVSDPPTWSLLRAVEMPRFAWATGEETVVAGGAAETIATAGPDRLATVRSAADLLLADPRVPEAVPAAARPRLFGGVAFHDEHTAAGAAGPWSGFPGACFVLPAVQLTVTEDGAWLTTAATGEGARTAAEERLAAWRERLSSLQTAGPPEPPGISDRRPTPPKAEWDEQVRAAVESVRDGTLRKVVLAQALQVDLDGDLDVPATLDRLGERDPECYRFCVQPDGGDTFFGATPERLVGLEGRTVRTAALAGSTGRGVTPEEDAWLAEQLRTSEKDAQEHRLVVEAIRDQLGRVADHVRTGDRTVRSLATVQHLRTPITATLTTDAHVLSLVDALHPTPAVGGLPPEEAIRTIRETETFDRGWYAAPVGWFDAAGDGTFAVGIRSAVAGDRRATLFAGDGIVADSDPDAEWDELQLKYRPILDELA